VTKRTVPLALLAAFVAASLALTLSGCSTPSAPGTGGSTTVVEKNFQFSPSSVSLPIGDTIVFDNQDSVPHHVVVGTADLGEQAPGKSVSWTATADGTFPVKCLIHASMTGRVSVGASGSGSSAPPSATTPPSTGGY